MQDPQNSTGGSSPRRGLRAPQVLRRPFIFLPALILGALAQFGKPGAAIAPKPAPLGSGCLEVHLIDVDQGLSVYVEGPTGIGMLIDGGFPGRGFSAVVPTLQGLGVTGLAYSVMTHWHTDHFGGMDEVFNSGFKPGTAAYDRGDVNKPSNTEVTQYMAAVSGVRQIANVGTVINLGGGATATIISANGNYAGGSVNVSGQTQEENARSLTVHLEYGDFDMIVPGDLTGGGNGTPNVEVPAYGTVGQVEVHVSGHHGSNTSSPTAAVNTLDPSVVLHSAGIDNSFGHPTETIVKRWNTSSATRVQWCITDGDTSTSNDNGSFVSAGGNIVLTSDGNTFDLTRAAGGEVLNFATFEQPGVQVSTTDLAITELLVDPQASQDTYGEWFEIANVSGATRDLFGTRYSVGPLTFTVASRVLLAPDERFVIGGDGRFNRNGQVFLGIGAPWDQFSMNNGSGSVLARTPGGATIESVSWGAGGVPVVSGVSAERIDPFAAPISSNFQDAQNPWAGADLGTPGRINDAEGGMSTCPTPIFYGTGKVSSIGTIPIAQSSGTPDLNVNDFVVDLLGGLPNKPGILFYGFAPASIPFMGHTLYVQPPIQRLPVQQTDALGRMSYPIPIDGTMPGTKRFYQFWMRDPAHPDGTAVGLSSALEVEFCPLGGGGGLQAGDLVITEVMRNPNFVPDSDGEWFEVYNRTAAPIDIEGWVLGDDGSDLHQIQNGGLGVVVPPGGYIVLGNNANLATNGGVQIDYEFSNYFLGNSGDEIVLIEPGGTEIDRVNYGSGWPSAAGSSMSLSGSAQTATLNDSSSNWCLGQTTFSPGNPDKGTPGLLNPNCP